MRHIWLKGHNRVISENIFTTLTNTLMKYCHIQFNLLEDHTSTYLFFWFSEIVEMKQRGQVEFQKIKHFNFFKLVTFIDYLIGLGYYVKPIPCIN